MCPQKQMLSKMKNAWSDKEGGQTISTAMANSFKKFLVNVWGNEENL